MRFFSGKVHIPDKADLKQMKSLMGAVICIQWKIIKQLILMSISRQIKLLAGIVVARCLRLRDSGYGRRFGLQTNVYGENVRRVDRKIV